MRCDYEDEKCVHVDPDSIYLGNGLCGPEVWEWIIWGPLPLTEWRNLIGGVALLPCIAFLGRGNRGNAPGSRKDLIIGGVCCGVLLFAASSLQQIGLVYTTAGKSGFITAFYIVIVPVLGIFLRQKVGWKIWTAVGIALVGLYFLCITEGFSVNMGDFYVFLCALLFSLHILVIDHFAPRVDGVKMSCIQFFVCGLISLIPMFALETPTISGLLAGGSRCSMREYSLRR